MVGPTRPQFVLFGSSIVQMSYGNNGWGAILTDLYSRKADILLRGYAGWNSRRALQILDRVFPKDAAIQPSLVIVYFGGNDSIHPHPTGLGPHVPLTEYIDNMAKIALHLKDQMRKDLRARRTNDRCRIYSEACLELCREMNIKAVDLWTAIQKVDDRKNICFTDGIHLSSEGSKIVVKEILKVIEEADWEPNLNWKIMPSEFSEDSPYHPVSPAGVNLNISNSNSTFHGTMMNSFDF